MRISYWSSDVCSSDLSRAKRERKLPPGYCSTRARTRCVQIDKRSSCRLRSIPLSLACQSFRSRTSAVSKARPCSSNVSMIAPESSTTTSSVTCRAYGRNLVGITSLSATFIGTCSDRRLALAIAAEPLSLDALQGEGRVARPAPKDAVAVGRLGAAPQEELGRAHAFAFVSKARPGSSTDSMVAPESRTTTWSVTCRAYCRNVVCITSLSATFIGTCSDRRLALAIAAEPRSLEALQGEGRVARPAPKDSVAVGRLGAAPQEDQPESVHVVADYETRDAEHHRGDDPAIDRIGRANQGDDRRQQDHHSRFDRAAREERGPRDRKSTRLNSSH